MKTFDEIEVAVVTGGGHGIGRAICRRLSRKGRKVIVADVERDAAETVAEEIGGYAFALDVSDESGMQAFIREVEESIGPIDLFVSNAGVGYGDADGEAASKEGGMNPCDDR